MKHLKIYESFGESINEKITWKDFVIGAMLYFGTGQVINYNSLSNMYKQVNSEESIPDRSESKVLEPIRSQMIEQISNSDEWNKFNKSNIIDSLKTIRFIVIDSVDYYKMSPGSAACFIDLSMDDEILVSHLLDKPTDNGIIAIRKDVLKRGDLAKILTHELYHYVDKLYSAKFDFSNFLDSRLQNDDKWAMKKSILLTKNMLLKDPDQVEWRKEFIIAKEVIDYWLDKFSYYSSNSEIFARWMALKSEMLKSGHINSINQKVTISDLIKWRNSIEEYNYTDDMAAFEDLLFFLDWKKVDQIDDYIMSK